MVSSVGKRGPNLNFWGWSKDRDRFLKNFRDFLGTGMTSISGFFGILSPKNFLGFFGDGDDFNFGVSRGFIPENPPKNFWGFFGDGVDINFGNFWCLMKY